MTGREGSLQRKTDTGARNEDGLLGGAERSWALSSESYSLDLKLNTTMGNHVGLLFLLVQHTHTWRAGW